MTVSRKTNIYPVYYIAFGSVPRYNYLGVHITSKLAWNANMDCNVNNANRVLGYLQRNFFMAPISLELLFYEALVRTKLKYAAAV